MTTITIKFKPTDNPDLDTMTYTDVRQVTATTNLLTIYTDPAQHPSCTSIVQSIIHSYIIK